MDVVAHPRIPSQVEPDPDGCAPGEHRWQTATPYPGQYHDIVVQRCTECDEERELRFARRGKCVYEGPVT